MSSSVSSGNLKKGKNKFLMRILPSPLADKPWLKLCQILARRLDQTEEKLHHCHGYDIWKTNAYAIWFEMVTTRRLSMTVAVAVAVAIEEASK